MSGAGKPLEYAEFYSRYVQNRKLAKAYFKRGGYDKLKKFYTNRFNAGEKAVAIALWNPSSEGVDGFV